MLYIGLAESAIVTIAAAMVFIYIATLPYMSLRILMTIIKHIKNKANNTVHGDN